MSIIQLPQNQLQQVKPLLIFDETFFPLAPAGLKQYLMTFQVASLSLNLLIDKNTTIVASGLSPAGSNILYYNGALAANVSLHLEIGLTPMLLGINITNVDVANANVYIALYGMQYVT